MKHIYAHLIIQKGGIYLKNNKKVTAIILVAGNSTRYGQNRNKNFEIINGKEVLLYSLEKFNSAS